MSNWFAVGLLLLTIPACSSSTDSQLRIVNGALAAERFGFVTGLKSQDGICTGSFLSPKLILTAAHCVRGTVQYKDKTPSRIGIHPDWNDQDHRFDLAVLQFDAELSDATIATIATTPDDLSNVTLVGYGCDNSKTSAGATVKRTGTNQAEKIDEMFQLQSLAESTTKDGTTAGACRGDSGGPMLVDTPQGIQQLGVASTVKVTDNQQVSKYVDLTHTKNLAFLARPFAAEPPSGDQVVDTPECPSHCNCEFSIIRVGDETTTRHTMVCSNPLR